MSLQWLGLVRFYKLFNHNPEALRRLLSLYISSEARGEISPLTVLARHLPDCPLRDMVRQHLLEEGRHLKLLRARLAEIGEPFPIPKALELQEYHFDRESNLNDVLSLSREEALRPDQVIEILLFASVLEEFVVSRMTAHAEAASEEDPRTYFMLMEILVDEIRHSIYTQQQAYLIAGQERLEFARRKHAWLRARMSKFGAQMFKRVWDHLLPFEVLRMSRLEYLGWRLIVEQQVRTGTPVVMRMPSPRPDRLITRPFPYGSGARPVDAGFLGAT